MNPRYRVQMRLTQVGKTGQQRLAQCRVLCIGAGGLANAALYYLASAGIGTIAICDGDTVAFDNLQRQILFKESDVGKNKSTVAVSRLNQLNSSIQYIDLPYYLSFENVVATISSFDYVLDATDNFKTKILLNDVCHFLKKPLVSASVAGFIGQCAVFQFPGPCWRCVYPELENNLLSCADTGVLGAFVGMIGSFQALEVLKCCLALKNDIPRLWYWDGLRATSRVIELSVSPDCPLCTGKADFVTLWQKQSRIGESQAMQHTQITPIELAKLLETQTDIFLLDVRAQEEHRAFNIGGTLIPLMDLSDRVNDIPHEKPIVVYCHSGYRSQIALEFLQQAGFKQVQNLVGGVLAWQAYMHNA